MIRVIVSVAGLSVLSAGVASGQSFVDPGFESYAVSPGGFVRPTTGPWGFGNDAGVVEPFSPPTSTGVLSTWSATLPAFEGRQYASTYAGADVISQRVTFSRSGTYIISVRAAAPSGSVTFPGQPPFPLVNGQFRFRFDVSPIGVVHTVPAGSGWTRYSASFTVPAAGTYFIAVENTLFAPYFINYDAFEITPQTPPCFVDCNADGLLDVRDFTCFQNAFAIGDRTRADCDANGLLDVRDFTCFQNRFALGCS